MGLESFVIQAYKCMYRSFYCYIHFIKLANKSGPTKSPNTLRSKSKSKPFPPSKKINDLRPIHA